MTTRPSGTTLAVLIAGGCLLLGSTGGAIAASAITSAQIKNETITNKDVKNGTLTAKEFAADTLLKGPRGEQGVAGGQGPQGDQGPAGPPGVANFSVVGSDPVVSLAAGATTGIEVFCPSGQKALGGGGGLTSSEKVYLLESRPINGPVASVKGWWVKYYNSTASAQNVFAVVTCATVG